MRRTTTVLLAALLGATVLTACGDSSSDSDGAAPASAAPSAPACPGAPVPVAASVDQWGAIARSLGGSCAEVTTVLNSSSGDPHDYEPTVADIAAFDEAEVVVINGADYDHWAEDAASGAASKPAVIDAAAVAGVEEGQDPHVWYGPGFVTEVADAITAAYAKAAPENAAYFKARAAEWDTAMKPYFATIAQIKESSAGSPYAATEPVFSYLASALGLKDVTPEGYRAAAANESEPSPGDVAAFEQVLADEQADVLIYNKQTEGSVPEQLLRAAESADLPVVEVTENIAPGFATFEAWQIAQLTALKQALAL